MKKKKASSKQNAQFGKMMANGHSKCPPINPLTFHDIRDKLVEWGFKNG